MLELGKQPVQVSEAEHKMTRRSLLRFVKLAPLMFAPLLGIAATCEWGITNTLSTLPSQPTNEGWRVMYPKAGATADYVAKDGDNAFSTLNPTIEPLHEVDPININGRPTGISSAIALSDEKLVPTLRIPWRRGEDALALRTGDVPGVDKRVIIFENVNTGEKHFAQIKVKEEPTYSKTPSGFTKIIGSIKIIEMVPVQK